MAARDPIIGRTIADRYRVEARIGRGGFGAVYRATHLGLDRPVALKVMHGDGGDDLGQRFRREARLQASLRHPVCVIVFDYGEDDGDPWLVQEFVTGHELKAVLAAEGRLPPERAVAITCRLLEGLAAAHDSGIVHRDIKPSNIMLVRDGDREDVRLLDFGIARAMAEEETSLTSPGQVIGTARYIAPEQARGEPPAPASDLYSVGVVLHQMLAGAPPFPAFDMREAVIAHLTLDPPPLPADVPPKLAAVVAQALAKHPADRPPSAAAMIDRLRAAMRPPAAPPPAAPPTADNHSSRTASAAARRGLPPSVALLAITLLGGGALAGALLGIDARQPPPAVVADAAAEDVPPDAAPPTPRPRRAAAPDAAPLTPRPPTPLNHPARALPSPSATTPPSASLTRSRPRHEPPANAASTRSRASSRTPCAAATARSPRHASPRFGSSPRAPVRPSRRASPRAVASSRSMAVHRARRSE
ncbi:MAG: protein kinase [Myxococcales bacterium]|nr:protein kinase [Myxococcales bacterium]